MEEFSLSGTLQESFIWKISLEKHPEVMYSASLIIFLAVKHPVVVTQVPLLGPEDSHRSGGKQKHVITLF